MNKRTVTYLITAVFGIAAFLYADAYPGYWEHATFLDNSGLVVGQLDSGCGSWALWGQQTNNEIWNISPCSPSWQGDGSWCWDYGSWLYICYDKTINGQRQTVCQNMCVVPPDNP